MHPRTVAWALMDPTVVVGTVVAAALAVGQGYQSIALARARRSDEKIKTLEAEVRELRADADRDAYVIDDLERWQYHARRHLAALRHWAADLGMEPPEPAPELGLRHAGTRPRRRAGQDEPE